MSDEPGLLGDGDMKAGKYNMRLVNRAIRNGWNIPDGVKRRVVKQMAKIAIKSEEERNQIAAAKVLVSADGVDVSREKIEKPDDPKTINNTQINNYGIPAELEKLSDEQLLRIIADTECLASRSEAATGAIEVSSEVVSPPADRQAS